MDKTIQVQNLLRDQIAIMDKHDPGNRSEMYVDEWGTWWNQEPGSQPGFLYQQNTIRDAVSAGIYLNEFNKHCHRVKMANIAQTVNVLQAMVLTEGAKMLLTPTYHVFEMYKMHQGGKLLNNELTCNTYARGGTKLPALNVSASKSKDGAIYVSICNIDPTVPAELKCTVEGAAVKSVTGRVLTAETMNAHNTFDNPNIVQPAELKGIELKDGQILATLPSKSVTVLRIE
jgi:alpha-N-arabinofuranosidase